MQTDSGQFVTLVPMSGDPEACQLPVGEEGIRYATTLLGMQPVTVACSQAVTDLRNLARRDAARGREIDRMRSLVLGVMSGEAQQGLQDEIDLLTDRVRRLQDEIDSRQTEYQQNAEDWTERYQKLEERRRRTADAARRHYGAWMSASVRLEHQAETIRRLESEVKRLAAISAEDARELIRLREDEG